MADDLDDVGIDVTINSLNLGAIYGAWSIGDFDGGVHSFWVNAVDPDVTMRKHFHTNGIFNYNRYSNSDFDLLADQMRQTLDPFERRELAWDAMEIALNDQAKIIVAHSVYVPIVNANVRGFMPAVSYLGAYGPQNRYDHVWLAE